MTERRLLELTSELARRDLLSGAGQTPDPAVVDVIYDSRRARPGSLFVAMAGQHADGADHALAAVRSGAVAVVAEREIDGLGVPLVRVHDGRAALAVAAAWHAGFPARELGVIGITGTDGKTTTAYLIRAMLEATGGGVGMVGTTDVVVGGRHHGNAARTTTPEAPELQRYLADMVASGDRWAVLEATSHGLAQRRVGAIAFDLAVLTNVTSEHLEFHGTLEAYRRAKRRLFEGLAGMGEDRAKPFGRHAILNADDPISLDYADAARGAGARVLRYGLAGELTRPAPGRDVPEAEIVAVATREDPSALHVVMRTPDWEGEVALRLAGRFNIHNALAAMAVSSALGIPGEEAAAALAALESVPGRMQRIDRGQPFTVVVDYAHTAEALAKVLDELAPEAPAGLIAVFGSAGERDTQKRPQLGRVAAERARLVVVTDEDPRREDRGAINEAIAVGAEGAGKRRGDDLLVVPDRAEAIGVALAAARPGDTVVLAGKGHEKTIEVADGDIPWDEAGVAIAALETLGYG